MMPDNITVLYVEDDQQSREIMQLLLQMEMGLTNINIFADSSDFITRVLVIQPKPDVILLDIHLRPHDGFEMLSMLRQQPTFAAVPIVALTASVMNEEVQKLKNAGFNGVIAKPIDVDTFPGLLSRILHGESIWRIIE
jgi:CheY-like chemotaxis protein